MSASQASMLRHLFRRRVTPASLLPFGQQGQGSKTRFQESYSILMTSLTSRGQAGVTYSQWRYWKQVAGTRAQFVQSIGDQWSGGRNEKHAAPETMTDVFERFQGLLETGCFHPGRVADFSVSLRSAVYSNLGWLPWFHNDNHVIAFMQLLMNGKTEYLLKKPLYSQEHFDVIYRHLDHLADQVPSHDCPSILVSLIYSGLDRTEPLVHKLLARCHDSIPDYDIHQLRDLTHVFQSLGGRDFALAGGIVSRLQELLNGDVKKLDFEIRDLCVSNPVLAVFMSRELVEKCAAVVLSKLREQSPHLDVFTIGCCFRYARKMKFRVSVATLSQIKMLGKTALEDMKDFSHLQSYHIAEICHNARNLGCFSGQVVEKIQSRSLQLLRENDHDLQICDITNLLFAFSKDASPALKQEMCQLLLDHMENADVLTLSNIADNILDLGLYDLDLISLFQYKVMQNIHNISQYITRLVKILRLLRERHEIDTRFNQHLCSVLLKMLDRRRSYDPTLVVVVAQFILPNIRNIIPVVLMESLLYAIPRCNLSLMLMILSSLNKVKSPRSRSLHNQMLDLRSCMQQNIGNQIQNTTRASQLADLVKGLYIKSRTKDLVLLDHIMDHFPTHTSSMVWSDFFRTLFVFRRMPHPYYHPQVFEDLITFTKDNYCRLDIACILDLATILATAGYRPEDFDRFSAFMTLVLEETMEFEDYRKQITFAYQLSVMGIFPDHCLGHIFSFDYLQKLDRVIEEEENGDMLKNMMMDLNRSVYLECPHLDVPWFHQHYCQETDNTSKDFQKNSVMLEEVQGALEEVMSGLEYVSPRTYSPYFHPIDFEIVLDATGKPVTSEAVKLIQPDELGYQRVALMVLGNRHLCTNNIQRRGQYLRNRRHLEILGYRVKEISRHDWHSMALSNWEAKVDFVRSKVFGNGDKQLLGSVSTSVS